MKKKILIVDDEPDLLKVTLLRLNKSGYEALGAVDGLEALDTARRQMPDLIILDVILPKLYGDEVARILKKDAALKRIPIILISAMADTLDERASDCGAEGCLSKPFETEELLRMVEKLTPGPESKREPS